LFGAATILISGCSTVGQAISQIPPEFRPKAKCAGGLCEDIAMEIRKEDARKEVEKKANRLNQPVVSEQCSN
jgi:hypothetical protein